MSRRTFDEMDRMFEQMDRVMRRMQSRWDAPGTGHVRPVGDVHAGDAHAGDTHAEVALDWHTGDDAYTLVADLPGFEKEELDLSVEDGVLRIDAEHVVETEESRQSRHVHERVSLPDDAQFDDEDVAATYRNGVLEITIPRSDESSGTRIDVE